MNIVTEAAKLLAKETLGINVKVDMTKASFLVLKQQLKDYGKMCRV